MAGKDLTAKLTIDAKGAVSGLKDVADAADDTDKAIAAISDEEIKVEVDKALGNVDELKTRIERLTTEDQKIILTAETSKAETSITNINTKLSDIQHLSDQEIDILLKVRDEATQHLNDLTAEANKLDSLNPTIDVDVNTEKAQTGIHTTSSAFRDMTEAFGGADSALFGIGESFEGLGDVLEGFGGKLGLSEEAVAGLTTSLGGALGVLGAIGIAFTAGKAIIDAWGAAAKKAREEQHAFFLDLVKSGGDVKKTLEDFISTDVLQKNENLTRNLAALGISMSDLAAAANGEMTPAVAHAVEVSKDLSHWAGLGSGTQEKLAEKYGLSAEAVERLWKGSDDLLGVLTGTDDTLSGALESFRAYNAVMGQSEAASNAAAQGFDAVAAGMAGIADNKSALAGLDPLFNDLAAAADAFAGAADDMKRAHLSKEINDIMKAAEVDTLDELAQSAESFAGVLEDVASSASRNLRGLIDLNAALDDLGETLKKNGHNFDIHTKAGRENTKAVLDLGDAMRAQVENVVKAGGSFEDAERKAKGFRDELTKQLKAAGASDKQINELLHSIGLLPSDIKMSVELQKGQEAKRQLEDLKDVIDQLPPETKLKVTQQIETGDYIGAVTTVQNYAKDHPATQKVDPKAPTDAEIALVVAAVNTYMARHPANMPVKLTVNPIDFVKLGQDVNKEFHGVGTTSSTTTDTRTQERRNGTTSISPRTGRKILQ